MEEIKNINQPEGPVNDEPPVPIAPIEDPRTPSSPAPAAPPSKELLSSQTPPASAKVGGALPDATPRGGAPIAAPRGAVIKRGTGRAGKVLLVLFLIVLIGLGGFYLVFYRAQIKINPSPQPDVIVLDGKTVTPGAYKVRPGNHTVKIEKNGYVSFEESRRLKMNEKFNLDLALKKALEPQLIYQGGKTVRGAKNGLFVDFLSADNKIYSTKIKSETEKTDTYAMVPLSDETFPGLKQILFSNDNNFALILDEKNLKIADFAQVDPTKKEPAKNLPPAGENIHAITWNGEASDYVEEANAKIIYDMETSFSWDIFLADRAHTQAQVVMRLDKNRFKSLYLDWDNNPKQVLVVGGEIGILDLPSREYEQIKSDQSFTFAKWGPEGQYGLALNGAGEVYLIKDKQLQKLDLKTAPELVGWTKPNEAAIASGDKITKIDFDTMSRINYAEVKGLKNAKSMYLSAEKVFFTDSEGLKVSKLVKDVYGAANP